MNASPLVLFSLYERIWHWLQAVGIGLLLLTGMAIHAPGWLAIVPFDWAVTIHNALGLLLVVNAALGLFYYLTTGAIVQYLPEPKDFISLSLRQARYYLHGVFRGEPHPFEKTRHRRLNPLQQATYLVILNVLLPLQMLSGMTMWLARFWPDAAAHFGGLSVVAPLHTLGAWLFAAFLFAHIYLATTGATVVSNFQAMVLGYEKRH